MFVELRGRLQDLAARYGLLETLDQAHFYDQWKTRFTDIWSTASRHLDPLSHLLATGTAQT